MSDCPHYSVGHCALAEQLAGVPVATTPGHCQYCSEQASSARSINPVVVSLALHAVSHDPKRSKHILDSHGALLRIQPQGPGTELKKLLSWWFLPDASCDCDARALQMNTWGAAGCRQHLERIVDWLLEAAAQRGLPHGPLTRHATRLLVKRAIHNAELATAKESLDALP